MSKAKRKSRPYKPKHIHLEPPTRKVEVSTPEAALEQFVFEAASNLIQKVQIMDTFIELLPTSAEAYEVHLNFRVAALALVESLNIMHGDIPPRILQKYGVETNEQVSNPEGS